MKREFNYRRILLNFVYLIAAIVLGLVLIPIGGIYHIGKLIYEFKFRMILHQVHRFFYHILNSISYIAKHIAIGIDLLGNVMAGELLEDIVTSNEDTFYGHSEYTISAATGKLEQDKALNKTGLFFTSILSKVFEKNHAILAYRYILVKNYIEDRIKEYAIKHNLN